MPKPLSEQQIENRARKYAYETYGATSTKMNVKGQVGELDVVFWFSPGYALIIEFKKLGERPKGVQLDKIKEYRERGFVAEWCDDLPQAVEIIDEFARRTKNYTCPSLNWSYRSNV